MAELETDPETDTERPKKKGGKGARASIQVNDIPMDAEKATDMMAAASGGRRRGGGGTAGEDRASLQRFSRAVKDPNNKIIATRQQPPVTDEGVALGDTYDIATHEDQSEEEIRRDIAEARGGRKWIVRVYDPDNQIIACRSVTVGGQPRLDPMFGNGDLQEEPMEPQTELSEQELLEQTLARDPEIMKAQKNLRLRQLQNEQEEEEAKAAELRARRVAAEKAMKGEGENGHSNGNGRKHRRDENEEDEDDRLMKVIEASNAPLKEANAALQRRLDEAERRNSEKESKAEQQRMIEAQTGPLKDMLAAQKTAMDQMMAKLNAPPPTGPTTDAILAKLDAMKVEIKGDTKDQIMAVVTQLTSKIDTVATTLNTFMAKGSDPATNALIALATSGNKGGAAPVDPYAGLERALKALQNLKSLTTQETVAPPDFPSYLVEKVAETTPEVLNFFKEQRGAVPTKEEIEKMMRGAATKMYEGLDASWKNRMQEEFARLRQQQGLPAAAPAPAASPTGTPAPSAPQVTVQPTSAPGAAPSVVAFPGSAAPAAQAPAAAPAAPAAAVPDAPLTPDQLFQSLSAENKAEFSKRVNHVLGGLAREMELGIQAMGWPEQAQSHLPKAIIDQIVEATKDSDIHDIVKHYAKPELTDKIWGYLSPSNKNHEWYQGWLAQGINWIKEANGVEIVEEGEPPVVEDAPG
jgi:hypothetical protein